MARLLLHWKAEISRTLKGALVFSLRFVELPHSLREFLKGRNSKMIGLVNLISGYLFSKCLQRWVLKKGCSEAAVGE